MSIPDEKSLYEQQEKQLLDKTDAFLGLLTKRGILYNVEIENEKVRQVDKERRKIAYHNTLMLLKNYRQIMWQADCEASRIAEELELPLKQLDAILSRIDAEIGMGNRKVETKLENMRRFRVMIDRVNEALTLLQKKPGDGERLYELIYLTYLSPNKIDQNDVLYRMNISRRQFYRLRRQAVAVLSIRLWAVPTKNLDVWLDFVTLFEGEIGNDTKLAQNWHTNVDDTGTEF